MTGAHRYQEENFLSAQNMQLTPGSGLTISLRRKRPERTLGDAKKALGRERI